MEAAKWGRVLEGMGHEVYWFGGKLGTPPDRSWRCEKAFFGHPDVEALQRDLFGTTRRTRESTAAVSALKDELKAEIAAFVERFGITLLIPQNVLSIPMHIPLGLAVAEFLTESGLPAIAHHHDFAWERDRFAVNAAADYLEAAFPPDPGGHVRHVAINSIAAAELGRRRAIAAAVIPNVFDFDTAPPAPGGHARPFREALGIPPDHTLVLQPTRVVPRKGIEFAIDLVAALDRATLVVSHDAGDEGMGYYHQLVAHAEAARVRLVFAGDQIGDGGAAGGAGGRTFTLADAYQSADLVTYPSLYEGFGNAFLEAIYFRRPLVVNRYPVYDHDIRPHGFKLVEMDGRLTPEVVSQARALVADKPRAREWADHNYRLGQRHFSHQTLERQLTHLVLEVAAEGSQPVPPPEVDHEP